MFANIVALVWNIPAAFTDWHIYLSFPFAVYWSLMWKLCFIFDKHLEFNAKVFRVPSPSPLTSTFVLIIPLISRHGDAQVCEAFRSLIQQKQLVQIFSLSWFDCYKKQSTTQSLHLIRCHSEYLENTMRSPPLIQIITDPLCKLSCLAKWRVLNKPKSLSLTSLRLLAQQITLFLSWLLSQVARGLNCWLTLVIHVP